MRILDARRSYWEQGLYDHATRMLGREMSDNTTFFSGHLWNVHFHLQTGDTTTARISLRRLNQIDSANSLVRNFHTLLDLRKALRVSVSPTERSALRLRTARIDREIELFDESWDQALAAVADEPGVRAMADSLQGLLSPQAGRRAGDVEC